MFSFAISSNQRCGVYFSQRKVSKVDNTLGIPTDQKTFRTPNLEYWLDASIPTGVVVFWSNIQHSYCPESFLVRQNSNHSLFGPENINVMENFTQGN